MPVGSPSDGGLGSSIFWATVTRSSTSWLLSRPASIIEPFACSCTGGRARADATWIFCYLDMKKIHCPDLLLLLLSLIEGLTLHLFGARLPEMNHLFAAHLCHSFHLLTHTFYLVGVLGMKEPQNCCIYTLDVDAGACLIYFVESSYYIELLAPRNNIDVCWPQTVRNTVCAFSIMACNTIKSILQIKYRSWTGKEAKANYDAQASIDSMTCHRGGPPVKRQ